MDKIRISVVSGAALLALTATASAGPMTVPSAQVVSPPIQIEQAHYYYRHHYRHYGWHRAGITVGITTDIATMVTIADTIPGITGTITRARR